ncbi:MAG: DUF5943 domain-containing protein [Rhodospirillales bacterium]|jgi:predicted hydrocarbon binding protein|nr:DUF5943 domain-containing protein [Rhodospirillales bacterium]
MHELPVPVEVDPETGTWSVDGQPMILMPRHFWAFVQMEAEKRFGVEAFQAMLFEATYKAARLWCEREARTHGLAGPDILVHYLKRMTQRGLGRLTIEDVDYDAGTARVRLDHSVYVAEYGTQAGRGVCYMFTGALVGGMEAVAQSIGRTLTLKAEEVQCAACGAAHCRFVVSPR